VEGSSTNHERTVAVEIRKHS